MKRSFVERNGDRIIVYPFFPLNEKLRFFKEQQIKEIPKSELFYKAIAYDEHSEVIRENHYGYYKGESDLFTSAEIGFHLAEPFEWMCKEHTLEPVDNSIEAMRLIKSSKLGPVINRLDYDRQSEALGAYLWGSNKMKPFRVEYPSKKGNQIECFLPTSSYEVARDYRYMYPIIHITRMAYLLELLENNRMSLLNDATTEEFTELLKNFKFGEAREISLKLLRSMCTYINDVRNSYGAESPYRSEHQDLIDRSKSDKPFIEEVKRMALK